MLRPGTVFTAKGQGPSWPSRGARNSSRWRWSPSVSRWVSCAVTSSRSELTSRSVRKTAPARNGPSRMHSPRLCLRWMGHIATSPIPSWRRGPSGSASRESGHRTETPPVRRVTSMANGQSGVLPAVQRRRGPRRAEALLLRARGVHHQGRSAPFQPAIAVSCRAAKLPFSNRVTRVSWTLTRFCRGGRAGRVPTGG